MSKILEGIFKQLEEETLDEDLRKWFKEKWVRFNPQGKIMGSCARGDDSEGKPKCLPQAKAHSLGKKGRKYAASKKRREDPDPERKGAAKNVATKKKSNEGVTESVSKLSTYDIATSLYNIKPEIFKRFGDEYIINLIDKLVKVKPNSHPMEIMTDVFKHLTHMVKTSGVEEQLDELKCWPGYTRVRGVPAGAPGSCKKKTNEEYSCPHCGGELVGEELMMEKKDACYYKVKSRYKVWPSAYASGALVKCRKKGAKNWGNKSESAIMRGIQNEEDLDEEWTEKYKRSIDCNNPKGFSQRAHCQGKKK